MITADNTITEYSQTGMRDIPLYTKNFYIPDVQGIDSAFALRVQCAIAEKYAVR